MKIYTKEDLIKIDDKYRLGQVLSRDERIWHQNIVGVRKAGSFYALSTNELREYAKCFSGIDYFANSHCNIKKEDGRVGQMNLRDYQKDMINHFKRNKYSILFTSRQIGKTVAMCIMLLHSLLFNDNQKVIIITNKGETGKEVLRKLKEIYKLLPFYLKQGVTCWNQKLIVFENGSRIELMTNTKTANWKDYDIIYIDEFSRIPDNIINPMYYEIMKNLKEDGKFVISSGPNGFNLFYELVQNSERSEKDPLKNAFETLRVYYWQIPGRDENWAKEQIKMIGSETMFNQEYRLLFIGEKNDWSGRLDRSQYSDKDWELLNTLILKSKK